MMLSCKFARPVFAIFFCMALLTLVAPAPSVSAADGQAADRVIKKTHKGRLPSYYANVVTEKQREDIYKIQGEYKPKIDALKAQLDTLNKEMKEKISAVLTADQKKKIEDATTAAKAKRAKDKPIEAVKPVEKAEK